MSQQINLFNPIFMKQRKYFSLLAMLQALGMIIAGSLIFYGYAIYQVDQLNRQLEENTKRYNAEQMRLARFVAEFSPQQANQLLQDEVQRLEKQIAEQNEIIETLKSGAVGNTIGYLGIYACLFAPGGARLVVDRFQSNRRCCADQPEWRSGESGIVACLYSAPGQRAHHEGQDFLYLENAAIQGG